MNGIYGVEALDGNVYQVKYSDDSNSVTGASFDTVFNEINSPDELNEIFSKAASNNNVDVNLLKAVAYAESAFDANATSSCGAQGIMQLMPFVSSDLGISNPYDPEENINGGAQILASLLDKYNGNVTLSLAAYNAGSGAVDKYNGVPPYTETNNYIEKINNLLSNALDNDSRTLDNLSPTDLKKANVDIEVPSASKFTEASNSRVNEQIPKRTASINDLSYTNRSLRRVSIDRILLELLKIYSSGYATNSAYSNKIENIANRLVSLITNDKDTNLAGLTNGKDYPNMDYGLYGDVVALGNNLFNNAKSTENTDLYGLYEASAATVSPRIAKLRGKN